MAWSEPVVTLIGVGVFLAGVAVGVCAVVLRDVAAGGKDEPSGDEEGGLSDGVVDVASPYVGEVVDVDLLPPPVEGWPEKPPKHSRDVREYKTRDLKDRYKPKNVRPCECPPTPAGDSGLNRGHLPGCNVLLGYLNKEPHQDTP